MLNQDGSKQVRRNVTWREERKKDCGKKMGRSTRKTELDRKGWLTERAMLMEMSNGGGGRGGWGEEE